LISSIVIAKFFQIIFLRPIGSKCKVFIRTVQALYALYKMFKSFIFAKHLVYWSYQLLFSMTIGEHIALLRKRKKLSQAALGKSVGTSGDIIGRYERDIITPSIEVIMKIADALNVSIDFLVGKSSLELDTQTLGRMEEIATLTLSIVHRCLKHRRSGNYTNSFLRKIIHPI